MWSAVSGHICPLFMVKGGFIMETCNYLLYLALILMCTKFLGLLTRRARMPQVVGALLAGLLLGPAVFKIIPQTEFLTQTAEVGVVILMFCAGMETDVKELKKCGKAATIIAVIGVLVPLAGGFATAWFFNRPGMIESNVSTSIVLQNVFIGVILTATSVSITVETLKELGKLNSAAGNAILGAAVIDDILGIIALTVITSMADPTVKLWVVLVKIVGFFVFAAVAGFLFYKFFNYYSNRTKNGLQRYVIISFVFCLLMSYVAEEFFGVADITGAYVAGLVVSMIQKEDYLASRFFNFVVFVLITDFLCQHWFESGNSTDVSNNCLVRGYTYSCSYFDKSCWMWLRCKAV